MRPLFRPLIVEHRRAFLSSEGKKKGKKKREKKPRNNRPKMSRMPLTYRYSVVFVFSRFRIVFLDRVERFFLHFLKSRRALIPDCIY